MTSANSRTQPDASAVSGDVHGSARRPSGPLASAAAGPAMDGIGARAVTVFARGEIDVLTAPALDQDLRGAHSDATEAVVLDLEGVTFMDSAGIHLLLDAQQRASSGGYRFGLRHVPAQTRRLFNLAGVAPQMIPV
ncbi:MAG TPA: STAS domain-containing protein [Solirubrobacteraceae bacterium]|nr:STAS domain-containing protein [Solirubrobacteraceae bacterium]